MPTDTQYERRQLLAQLVKFLFFIALLAFSWVIISSLTIDNKDGDKGNQQYLDVDVTGLKAGQIKKVSMKYREVWIYHRSKKDIEQLKKQKQSLRSVRDDYFVFFPYEPKRGCMVNWDDTARTFYDTCNARHFDLAGRLMKKVDSHPVQLAVPDYRYATDRLIQIDVRLANIR